MHTAFIDTERLIEFNLLVDRLNSALIEESNDGVYIMSADEESLRLAHENRSLQGVAISHESGGYRLSIRSLSSEGDYILFKETLVMLTDFFETGALIDDEIILESHGEVKTFNWGSWIRQNMKDDLSVLKDYVNTYGEARDYEGVFYPFSVGPRYIQYVDVNDLELVDSLTLNQWVYRGVPTAQSGILRDEDTKQPMSLTIFDSASKIGDEGLRLQLSEALAVANSEKERIQITRFRHTPQIFDMGRIIDENQIYLEKPLTDDQIEKISNVTSVFYEQNIFRQAVPPGNEYVDDQRTFILMWNPDVSNIKMGDYLYWMGIMRSEDSNWSFHDHEQVRVGDAWYLMITGYDGPKGIIASGLVDSLPWLGKDWSGRERKVYYCDLYPNAMADPQRANIISLAELKYHMPDFEWEKGHSGRRLSEKNARILSGLWHDRLEKWLHRPNGSYARVFRFLDY